MTHVDRSLFLTTTAPERHNALSNRTNGLSLAQGFLIAGAALCLIVGCGSSENQESTLGAGAQSVPSTSVPSASGCTEMQCASQGLHCAPASGCVACTFDDHCGSGLSCVGATCQPGVAPADCSTTTCPQGSMCTSVGGMAQCTPQLCEPSGTSCSPDSKLSYTCSADGLQFVSALDCAAANLVCVDGDCVTFQCTSGQPYCDGNTVQTCNSTGSGPTAGMGVDCGANTCVDGVCGTGSCTANATSCSGDVLTQCNAQGTNEETLDCGAEQYCDDTAQPASCKPNACDQGQQMCDGGGIASCKADGSGFETQACPAGTTCENAECKQVLCKDPPGGANGNGNVTVYWFKQGTDKFGDIACGYGIQVGDNQGNGDKVNNIATGNGELFGAMNTDEFGGASVCGACVELQHQGRSVTITIADHCPVNSNPTCTKGHIDLSRAAFQQLTGQNTGEIRGVNWKYVTCPTTGNVQFKLKKPDDMYWNEFVVLNHKYPIVKAEVFVDGQWVNAERKDYNYWLPPKGDMGSYRVRVTDSNGGIIEEKLELSGAIQGDTQQFACQ